MEELNSDNQEPLKLSDYFNPFKKIRGEKYTKKIYKILDREP